MKFGFTYTQLFHIRVEPSEILFASIRKDF